VAASQDKNINTLLSLIRKLKAENAMLREKIGMDEPDWAELESTSITKEERNALLDRS
jgi:hypothetical protein